MISVNFEKIGYNGLILLMIASKNIAETIATAKENAEHNMCSEDDRGF